MSSRQKKAGRRYESSCPKSPSNDTVSKKAPKDDQEKKTNDNEKPAYNGSKQHNKHGNNTNAHSNSKRSEVSNASKGLHKVLTESQLATFRTSFCDSHQASQCPNSDSCDKSHCLTWQRRNPYRIHYCPQLCPEIQFVKSSKKMVLFRRCTRGKHCAFAHSKEEELYHPLVYKTKRCSAYPRCTRYYCPFIHAPEETRSGRCGEYMEMMKLELQASGELDSSSDESEHKHSDEDDDCNGDLQTDPSSYLSSFAEALSTVHVDPENNGIMESTFRESTFDGNMDFSQPMSYADLVRSGGQNNNSTRDGITRVGFIACHQDSLNFANSQDPCLAIDTSIGFSAGIINPDGNLILSYNDLSQQDLGYVQTSPGGEPFPDMLVTFMSDGSDQEDIEGFEEEFENLEEQINNIDEEEEEEQLEEVEESEEEEEERNNNVNDDNNEVKTNVRWPPNNDDDYFNGKFNEILSLNNGKWNRGGGIF